MSIEIAAWGKRALRCAAAMALAWGMLQVEYHYHSMLRNTTVTYTLLLLILFFAIRWDRLETILAAIVGAAAFDYYFQAPAFAFKPTDPQSYIAVGAFLVTAIVVSQQALNARRRAAEALARKRETECLYQLGQALLASDSSEATVWTAVHQVVPIFGMEGAAFFLRQKETTVRAGKTDCLPDEKLSAIAGQEIQVDSRLRSSLIPVFIEDEPFGTLGLCDAKLSPTVLKSIAGLLATALDRVRASERLLDEKRVSESLLLNILPSEVADELRAKGMVSPKYFEDVTILFTDFVGFTLATEKMAAEELVEMLHDYFTAFDRIAARYRVEKMKTIGDSYMCISGLPQRNPSHPVDVVMAAFEMLEAVRERQDAAHSLGWKVRIGVHTGPVIAGVVGINKFAFDIWGDTVNFSSRMESSGEAGRINLSERTYSRVKDFFACEHRGKVMTKDKREHDMYFASGILPALLSSPDGHIPSAVPPAFLRRYHVYFQKDPPAFPEFLAGERHPSLPSGEEVALLKQPSDIVKGYGAQGHFGA
jgi:class 3 adenylate cyclase